MAYLLIPLILLLVSMVYYRKRVKPVIASIKATIIITVVAFTILSLSVVSWLVYLTIRKPKFPDKMRETMATTIDGVYTYDMLSGVGWSDKDIRKTYPELIIG